MEEIENLVNFLSCSLVEQIVPGFPADRRQKKRFDDGLSGRMGYSLQKLQYDIYRVRLENAFVGTDNRIYAFQG